MITLGKMKWSNIFSYGPDNEIDFNAYPIIQLVGKNGHGKSSIALILEEVLYNKNSKGIKKANILNRYVKDKAYTIELNFDKDGDNYVIQTTRSSTQSITLYKNGNNISAHTATGTFKLIEEILGRDDKSFAQLVNQSSSASLEFLTATDTNRKKFLIDFLNLTRYTEAFEVFKKAVKDTEKEVLTVETKLKTIETWLSKHSNTTLNELELLETPDYDNSLEKEAFELGNKLKTITETNKKIQQNNTYKKQLDSIPIDSIVPITQPIESDKPYISKIGEHKANIKAADTLINKIGSLNGTCPTCLQEVDRAKLDSLISGQEDIKKEAKEAIDKINIRLEEINRLTTEANKASKIKSEWENYHSLIDNSLPSDILSAEDLRSRLDTVNSDISRLSAEIKRIQKENESISAHNAKVKVIKQQIEEMQEDLGICSSELAVLNDKLSKLQVLYKTFSTNGLIAYKIECMVTDLETISNEYLAELSDGRFQLYFKISTGDKLSVVITDNGKDIEILALSSGERARVNTATLLALRKLMQSLSSNRLNLLILDETISNLDTEGKERLIEVLLKEEHLNTILVSHDYTHPLLEKVNVVKVNNISRLET